MCLFLPAVCCALSGFEVGIAIASSLLSHYALCILRPCRILVQVLVPDKEAKCFVACTLWFGMRWRDDEMWYLYACTLTSGPVPVLDVLRVVLATGVYWHEQLLNIQRDTPRFENSPPDHHIAVVGTCVYHTKELWNQIGQGKACHAIEPLFIQQHWWIIMVVSCRREERIPFAQEACRLHARTGFDALRSPCSSGAFVRSSFHYTKTDATTNQSGLEREFESAVFIRILNNENVKGKDPSLQFGESCRRKKRHAARESSLRNDSSHRLLQRPMSWYTKVQSKTRNHSEEHDGLQSVYLVRQDKRGYTCIPPIHQSLSCQHDSQNSTKPSSHWRER